jgi:hypothetical protein
MYHAAVMAESEPKPKLIELVAPGAGQGWKAVLKNGKPAVIHEIPVPPAEAAAAIPRIQRLADHKHPALSPVLAWGTDPNGIWVAVEPNEGTPLGTILSRGTLTPAAAAALGAAVLSGVAALHEAGIAMGGFSASSVRITGNGEVRLAGHPAAAVRGAPSQSDLRADVRSCGMAVCAAFGVDPAGAPAPPNIPPGLVVTMRSMASGAMGPAADRAQSALREMASALLAPDRQVAAQSELATRSSGRETLGVTPFVPQGTVAPNARPSAPIPAAPPAAPAPPAPAAPAPFVPRIPREGETPVRAPVSYDAPARSLQTYPSMPAPTFAPAAPTPPAPPEPPKPAPVPTWSEAPPRTPNPFDAPVAPAANNPPAPARAIPVPPVVPIPPAPRSPFESSAPAPASTHTPPAAIPAAPTAAPPPPPPAFTPPSPPPAAAAVPAPPPAPARPAWTPMEAPAWKTSGSDAQVPAASSTPPAAPAPPPIPRAPAPQPAARRPAGGGGLSERPTWLIPAIIAVVLILLLGTGGAIIMANRGSSPGTASTTPTVRTSPNASPAASPTTNPKKSPKTSPVPTGQGPLAVPNFGPSTADRVTKVQFCSAATPCVLGASYPPEVDTVCDLNACTVEVAIYFSKGPDGKYYTGPVSYVLKFFDRCAGTTKDLPNPPKANVTDYAVSIPVGKWKLTLPSGVKSAAIVAVSQEPAVAASDPLMLGGNSCA